MKLGQVQTHARSQDPKPGRNFVNALGCRRKGEQEKKGLHVRHMWRRRGVERWREGLEIGFPPGF